jgi:micrococcal nuclease
MNMLGKVVLLAWLAGCSAGAQQFEAGEAGEVVAIVDTLTVTLSTPEGRLDVRLAEIDSPPGFSPIEDPDLVLNRTARLEYGGLRRDRYSRALAQLYLIGETDVWLQADLISRGRARVLSYHDNNLATAELLQLENQARNSGLGMWGDQRFAIRDTHPDGLAQDLGSIQIVTGRVLDVTVLQDGPVYINFGIDYRTDFTIRVEASHLERFISSDMDLEALQGRRIRVRGWLYEQNGPMMRIDHPARIEILED